MKMKGKGAQAGMSKGVKDSGRPFALRARHPQNGRFRGDPPAEHRRVGEGGPQRYFRESMATPCHALMMKRVCETKKHKSYYNEMADQIW
jgi:hypothetical protein